MNVERIEQRFRELQKLREAGEIDDERFAAEVEKLQFRDRQGRLWMIGAATGQWHYEKEKGYWVQGEPRREPKTPAEAEEEPVPEPADKPVPPAAPPPVKPPSFILSKRVLLLILIVFVVIVLIMGSILVGPRVIPRTATPPAVGLVTKTATLSPTATPTQIPTDTPPSTAPAAQVTDTSSPTPITVTFTPPPTPEPPTPEPPRPTPEPPTSTPEPPTPEPPTIAGKIAFPVFDPKRGTYDIFIANADGTGRIKIKEEASQPCFNPDGTEITYRSWRSDKRGLMVAHTFGDDIWTIATRNEASRPSVSRAGTVYHCKEPDRPVHIYLARGTGGPKVIRWGDQRQPISGESPAWVSEEHLVYKGCVGASCGLYLTGGVYDGTAITQLTHDTTDTNPEASPDGKKVAFMSWRDGNWEIYIMDLDSDTAERLTDNAANDGLPIWSPDGRTIAFASDRSGEWAIWAMNPDGSNQRMSFPLEGSLHGYVWNAPLHERRGWEEERLSWVP